MQDRVGDININIAAATSKNTVGEPVRIFVFEA